MKRNILLIALTVLSSYSFAQLQAPVLTAPSDSAKNVTTTAAFDWNPALGGVVLNYELEISTDINFTTKWNSTVNGSSGEGIKMLFDTRYYWRVRANGISSTSPWSDVRTFTTQLNNFNLTSPFNNEQIGAVRVTLAWSNLKNLNYQVQYDTSAAFNSTALNTITLINPEIKASNRINQNIIDLIYDAEYKWRIRGFHSNDTSGWSPANTFTTGSSIGQLTVLDGANGIFIDTSLSARTMGGTDSYELRMDTSMVINSSSKEYVHLINPTPVFNVEDLLFGKTYYWEVRGINASNVSPWSGVWSFTTLNKVTTSEPASGAEVNQIPLFKWQRMPGIETFQIEVDDDAAFGSPLHADITGDLNEYSFPNNLGFGTFSWRVRAISSRDTSLWSDVVTFKTTPVGIETVQDAAEVLAYPNPVTNELQLKLSNLNGQNINVVLTDLSGRRVYNNWFQLNNTVTNESIRLDHLTDGMYVLEVSTEGYLFQQKVIKGE